MTLTEFLLARIAEDEEALSDLTEPTFQRPDVPDWALDGEWTAGYGSDYARIHPARVLAECEAKRRIVAEHSDRGYNQGDCEVCAGGGKYPTGECPTVRIMAAVYAGHPDYDASWRP